MMMAAPSKWGSKNLAPLTTFSYPSNLYNFDMKTAPWTTQTFLDEIQYLR